ncbi:bifunctional 5,10-methylenetetrahydrofolate dehydrogenase/5,10-methenyltetrahydrofolate cyclohydrolase [Haladaptatus sp. F3-133]|jgi:methylenetetrahydrofolate dehydrogenase (NADP+)/methenyltetrahydrofolate cyclohydrolase|uniref:Bifunctional protein FolD n=1 Tax=Halorutilus salinus TaxID=2487751 RepID=A0A9Q4GJJ6_9EURY|nr:bifunctional 5,10-methylenetetrahydrofolate dehydrogenase/5,10-methenyltetrahydrofolate cyclohydrolase [Halorutilus salinus]MCX2819291.1 bifunctional 5,10-methylenetetrahydrofolate dehydrogenase/5,10-methenyltetrahydrofolate cyclohydrolase [Halorutilus salinus]
MTDIIEGDEIAGRVRDEVTNEVDRMVRTPKLVAVLMTDDPASETYVRMKRQAADEVGIDSETVRIEPDAGQDELLSTVEELNDNEDVDGILVQLPLPDGVDEDRALGTVAPEKDVDGFHPYNKGLLMEGRPRFVPATPKGVVRMLREHGVELEGADVTVVGRSDIVGKPLASLLVSRDVNATVTVCHSRTDDVAEHTRTADIVVAAVGVPGFVTADMVSEDAVVVDVGINRVDDELVGDVAYDEVSEKVDAITPVPGGVGPMTVAALLRNTVEAARLRGADD